MKPATKAQACLILYLHNIQHVIAKNIINLIDNPEKAVYLRGYSYVKRLSEVCATLQEMLLEIADDQIKPPRGKQK